MLGSCIHCAQKQGYGGTQEPKLPAWCSEHCSALYKNGTMSLNFISHRVTVPVLGVTTEKVMA